MLEFLNANVVYWHWIVFGLALITIELFIPIFVTLWLGVAAILVGLLLLVFPFDFSVQLLLWAVISAGFVILWHKYVSPKLLDRTTAGLSREAMVGQVGLVMEYSEDQGRGRLRFSAPIIGNDEWAFIYEPNAGDVKLNNGDKVQVTDISGNHLIVKPK